MSDISDIIGKHIFILTAHPDDESFAAAGTIEANAQAGGQNTLLCATLGEKGMSHLKEPATEEELQTIRSTELEAAAELIGITELITLRIPDGGVDKYTGELFAEASNLITKLQPQLIMSFGPDGITGHKDHVAVSAVALQLAVHHKLPIAMFCLPQEITNDAHRWLKQRRSNHDHYHDEFTHSDHNIAIEIDKEIKLKALRCHKSQIDDELYPLSGFPNNVAEAILRQECFILEEFR